MPTTTTEEEPPPPKESRSEVTGLVKEKGRTTRANCGNKKDENKKPGINMKSPIQQTREQTHKMQKHKV